MKINLRKKRPSCRLAFTLIEVVVVIAIISILIALTLPAIQQSREAARRTQCSNNLRQIGIAIHSFHSAKGFLPPSRNYDHYTTWAFLILPYMEQFNLFESWDPELKYYYQSDEARLTSVPMYMCPSRRTGTHVSTDGDDILSPYETSSHVPGVLADYACSAGYGPSGVWNWIDSNGAMIMGKGVTDPPTVPEGGFAPPDAKLKRYTGRTRIRNIRDGASNTILVGEKHVRPSQYGIAHEDGAVYNGDHPASFSRCGGPGYPIARYPTERFQTNFGSLHQGICNFLFADGSTQPISILVSTDVLGRLTARNDGEVVSAGSY